MQTIMSETLLLQQYNSFPEELKLAVSSYFELLTKNYTTFIENKTMPSKIRQFGTLKGKIKMHDDFDEPLKCFNEYMK